MIGVLRRSVVEAIAALDASFCDDPLAHAAHAIARRTREQLEVAWLGLLDEIDRSAAMVEWTAAANDPLRIGTQALTRWIDDHSLSGLTRYGALSDRELLDAASKLPLEIGENGRFDAATATTDAELVRELGRRAVHDTAFVAELQRLAERHPQVFVRPAELPSSVLTALAGNLLRDVSWIDDAATRASAAGTSSMLQELARRDPGAVLELLDDDLVLTTMATWPYLDDGVVRSTVSEALHDHVVSAGRLGEGYAILGRLARLAPATFDEGMVPPFAQAVAASLPVYLPTLGPAIRNEGAEPVHVAPTGSPPTLELSSYDELRELFGALLRDDEAQVIIGAAIGGYTSDVASQLGPMLAERPGAEHVAQVADLVRDAADAEIAEARAAAAATLAGQRRIGSLIGSATSVLMKAAGIGIALRAAASQAINRVAAAGDGGTDRVEAALERVSVGAQTYDNLTVAAVAAALDAHGPELAPERREELTVHLQRVDEAGDDLDRRRTAIIELDLVAGGVPVIQRFVDAVRARSGVDELREHRRPD